MFQLFSKLLQDMSWLSSHQCSNTGLQGFSPSLDLMVLHWTPQHSLHVSSVRSCECVEINVSAKCFTGRVTLWNLCPNYTVVALRGRWDELMIYIGPAGQIPLWSCKTTSWSQLSTEEKRCNFQTLQCKCLNYQRRGKSQPAPLYFKLANGKYEFLAICFVKGFPAPWSPPKSSWLNLGT